MMVDVFARVVLPRRRRCRPLLLLLLAQVFLRVTVDCFDSAVASLNIPARDEEDGEICSVL